MFRWIKGNKLKTAVLILILFVTTAVTMNSYIATWALRDFFQDHASDITIQDLTLRLRDSKLSIKGFSAKDLHGKKIEFDELNVHWSTADLFDRKITVHSIALNGLNVDVDLADFKLTQIGPLVLSSLSSGQETTTSESDSQPWSFELGTISLSDLNACAYETVHQFESFDLPLHLKGHINGCLNFSKLAIDTATSVSVEQKIQLNGDIALEKLKISSNQQSLFTIEKFTLSEIDTDLENISFEKIAVEQLAALLENDGSIADFGMGFEQLVVDKVALQINDAQLSVSKSTLDKFNVIAKASDNKMHPALKFDALNISQLNNQPGLLQVDDFQVENIQMLERLELEANSGHYISTLASFKVNNVIKNSEQFSIDQIFLEGLTAFLDSNNGQLNALAWLPVSNLNAPREEVSKEKTTSKPEAEFKSDGIQAEQNNVTENKATPTKIILSNFKLGSQSKIEFVDDSSGKKVNHLLHDILIEIDGVALNSDDSKPANLNYQMQVGDSGRITGKGKLTLKPDALALNIEGKLESIDLANLSAYAARFIGYRIEHGQLNIDYVINIANNMIDSNFKTRLEKFEIDELESHEVHELNQALGLPLPTALNLLRDSDDNIDLELPVTGKLDAPDFSIADIMQTVTAKAIKNAVIYNYSPLGMLSLASGVFDLATALRFEPIIFEPKSLELTDASKAQLDKVATTMKKKPKIKMKICGVATRQDLMLGEASDKTKADESIEIEPLLNLAKERQKRVMAYISESQSIEKNRLLGCNVKLAKKVKARPLVEISL